MKRLFYTALACLLTMLTFAQDSYPPLKGEFQPAKSLQNLPLVFSADFESGQADRFEPTDKSAWTITDQAGNKV
jgi:hypothetical protein